MFDELENFFTQVKPFKDCERGSSCYDAKCCRLGRKNWARRESWALTTVLKRHKQDGNRVYFGTCQTGKFLSSKRINAVMKKFHQQLSKLGKWRWYLELGKKNHVHVHFVLITHMRAVKREEIRSAWKTAMGEDYHQHSNTVVNNIAFGELERVAKYITGNTKGKEQAPMFCRGNGFRVTGGTTRFYPMAIAKFYLLLTRMFKAKKQAVSDGFIDYFADVKNGMAVIIQEKSIGEEKEQGKEQAISPMEYYLLKADEEYQFSRICGDIPKPIYQLKDTKTGPRTRTSF